MRPGLAAALALAASGCVAGTTAAPQPAPPPGRPLETLPAEVRLQQVEGDLLGTARERFGEAAVVRALASPTHLIVKRFTGMAPPPPPGAGPDWRPPTPAALLIKENGRWLVAGAGGWRAANAGPAEALDRILASTEFWTEPAFTQACPDYGASLLLLKAPGRERTVRNSQCTSNAATAVGEALQA